MSLIVISGVDGVGKSTQVNLLKNYLATTMEYDKDFTTVKFPRYNHPSSVLVRSYLNGEFGNDPDDIDPYLAGSFYAIDRGLSYQKEEWGRIYDDGGLVIIDRYYESNIVHQVAKIIKDKSFYPNMIRSQIRRYMNFIQVVENGYYRVPRPDLTFFLIMDRELNWTLLQHREHMNGDIHERNREYFDRCHDVLDNMIGEYNSHSTMYIDVCDKNHKLRTPEDIHNQIVGVLKERGFI